MKIKGNQTEKVKNSVQTRAKRKAPFCNTFSTLYYQNYSRTQPKQIIFLSLPFLSIHLSQNKQRIKSMTCTVILKETCELITKPPILSFFNFFFFISNDSSFLSMKYIIDSAMFNSLWWKLFTSYSQLERTSVWSSLARPIW